MVLLSCGKIGRILFYFSHIRLLADTFAAIFILISRAASGVKFRLRTLLWSTHLRRDRNIYPI